MPMNPWDGERMDSRAEMAGWGGGRNGAVKFCPSHCFGAAWQSEALGWQVERALLAPKQLKVRQVPEPKVAHLGSPTLPQK